MINLHERILPTSAGVEPATSWSPVGRASNCATEAGGPFSDIKYVIIIATPMFVVINFKLQCRFYLLTQFNQSCSKNAYFLKLHILKYIYCIWLEFPFKALITTPADDIFFFFFSEKIRIFKSYIF